MKHHAEDLFHTQLDQTEIDFAMKGRDVHLWDPPYLGRGNMQNIKVIRPCFASTEITENIGLCIWLIFKLNNT